MTQSLGGLHAHCSVDVHMTSEPNDGARLIVASDGLFAHVDHNRLVRALNWPAVHAARLLLDEALAAGGRDNISLGLLELPKPSRE